MIVTLGEALEKLMQDIKKRIGSRKKMHYRNRRK